MISCDLPSRILSVRKFQSNTNKLLPQSRNLCPALRISNGSGAGFFLLIFQSNLLTFAVLFLCVLCVGRSSVPAPSITHLPTQLSLVFPTYYSNLSSTMAFSFPKAHSYSLFLWLALTLFLSLMSSWISLREDS